MRYTVATLKNEKSVWIGFGYRVDWLLTSWTNFLRSGGICGSTCIFFSLATKL
jgi:hypothetical protein